MAAEIWVDIGSGNGLLPDGTKPLPGPVLIYDRRSLWHSSDNNFVWSIQNINSQNVFENYTFKITATSPRGQ